MPSPLAPLRWALNAHLASRHVSHVLNGAIIGLALVVALESHPQRAVAMIATLLATAVAVGLAEYFSHIVGSQTHSRVRIEGAQRRAIIENSAGTTAGIAFPAVFFVASAIGLFHVDTAFALAKWSGLALIMAYGFAAARLTGDSVPTALRRGALAGVLASILIIVEALLH